MSFLEAEDSEQVQGSDAWLKRRSKRIGASEVPAILGLDDWRDAHDVFKGKTEGETFTGNFATERGKQLEPVIRAKMEEAHGYLLSTPVLDYAPWPVLSCSLDGMSPDGKLIYEMKAPALWKHTGALCGIVPDTYQDQVQTQLLITGAELCYYCSFHDGEPEGFDLAVVEIYPDKERQEFILKRCQEFWKVVEEGIWREF